MRPTRVIVCVAAAVAALARATAAQVPVVPAVPAVPVDTTVHRFRVDASMLRPGQLTYRTTVERDTVPSVSTRTVTLSETSYNGASGWLVVDRRDGAGILVADSVTAGKQDLRAIHWASTIGVARLVVEFVGDSLYGLAIAPTGRRSILSPVPVGALVNAAMLETMLRLVPLQSGWQDSTVALSISVGTSAALFTRLVVTGEETVQVPAGSFDCWIVTATTEGVQAIYWVSKRDPVVVRSSQPAASVGGARVTNELTAVVR